MPKLVFEFKNIKPRFVCQSKRKFFGSIKKGDVFIKLSLNDDFVYSAIYLKTCSSESILAIILEDKTPIGPQRIFGEICELFPSTSGGNKYKIF